MRYKHSFLLIIGTVIAFTVWELIGHWFLMLVPMSVRLGLSIFIETGLALFITTVSIHAIWRQQQELQELASLRDYQIRMQAHYLHIFPEARIDHHQHLKYQMLEHKYADIQKSLASQLPETRASGLIDLKKLAQTHLTGMREQYPFFYCSVVHLTAVLYLESELLPRNEAMHALEAMSAFAHDNDPRLLFSLIDELAHANRAALSMMTDALAEHCAAKGTMTSDDYELLLKQVRFTASEETDRAVLRNLFDSSLCQESRTAQRILQNEYTSQKPDEALLMNRISDAVIKLRDTRCALAQALRALSAPDDIPVISDARRNWKRTRPLLLQNCFLVGADLNKTQLQGVDLKNSAMIAANLTDSQLQNSDMTGANLWQAQLFAAELENAKLCGANLQDTILTSACVHGADMSRSLLQGAHLIGTDLNDACLWQIVVANDTNKREHCANFTEANWWEARFTDQLNGSTDMESFTWLTNNFPKPALEMISRTGTHN